MDILEYLDAATRHLTSPAEAKSVRDELYDHYLRALEAALADGHSFDDARRLALGALGPPPEIRPSAAAPRRVLALSLLAGAIGGAILSLASLSWLPATAGLSAAALLLQPGHRLRAALRRSPALMALSLVDGLVAGTYPLWAAGPYSYWSGPATFWVTAAAIALMIATPLYLVIYMMRHRGEAFPSAALSPAAFALAALASMAAGWRLYPVRPSPSVAWYAPPGTAGFLHAIADPIRFTLLWFLAVCALGAMGWIAQNRHGSRRMATDGGGAR